MIKFETNELVEKLLSYELRSQDDLDDKQKGILAFRCWTAEVRVLPCYR